MLLSRQSHNITISLLAIFFLLSPALAQENRPVQAVDPLTGKPMHQPAQEVVEQAQRADLSEANALVAESDYAGAESLLAGLQQEYPDDPALLLLRGELLLALGKVLSALREVGELLVQLLEPILEVGVHHRQGRAVGHLQCNAAGRAGIVHNQRGHEVLIIEGDSGSGQLLRKGVKQIPAGTVGGIARARETGAAEWPLVQRPWLRCCVSAK